MVEQRVVQQTEVDALVEELGAGLTQCAVDNFAAGVALVEQRGETDPARLREHADTAARAQRTYGKVFRTLVELADVLGVPRERLRSNPLGED